MLRIRALTDPHAVYRDIGGKPGAALHLVAAGLVNGPAALAHRAAACHASDGALAADLSAQAGEADLAAETRPGGRRTRRRTTGGHGAGHEERLLTAIALLLDLGDVARAAPIPARSHLPPSSLRSLAPSASWPIFLVTTLPSSGSPRPEWWPRRHSRISAVAACQFAIMLLGHHRTSEATQWAERAAGSEATGFTRACSHSVLGLCQTYAGRADRAITLLRSELARCADPCSAVMVSIGLGVVRLWTDGLEEEAAALLGAAAHRMSRPGCRCTGSSTPGCSRYWQTTAAGPGTRRAPVRKGSVALADDLDQGWLLCRARRTAVVNVCAGRGQWDPALRHTSRPPPGTPLPGSPGDLLEMAKHQGPPLALPVTNEGVPRRRRRPARPDQAISPSAEPAMLSFWPGYAWSSGADR